MRKFYIIGFFILLLFDTFAQISFKFAALHTSPAELQLTWLFRIASEKWVYFAILGYIGAFATWMTILKRAPIGPAYAASHMDIISVLLVSVLFLHEKLSAGEIVGSILILAGIATLGCGKIEHELK